MAQLLKKDGTLDMNRKNYSVMYNDGFVDCREVINPRKKKDNEKDKDDKKDKDKDKKGNDKGNRRRTEAEDNKEDNKEDQKEDDKGEAPKELTEAEKKFNRMRFDY